MFSVKRKKWPRQGANEPSSVRWAPRRLPRVAAKMNLKQDTIVSPSPMTCTAWVQSEGRDRPVGAQ